MPGFAAMRVPLASRSAGGIRLRNREFAPRVETGMREKKPGMTPAIFKFEFFFSPFLLQEMAPPRNAFQRPLAAANFTTSEVAG